VLKLVLQKGKPIFDLLNHHFQKLFLRDLQFFRTVLDIFIKLFPFFPKLIVLDLVAFHLLYYKFNFLECLIDFHYIIRK